MFITWSTRVQSPDKADDPVLRYNVYLRALACYRSVKTAGQITSKLLMCFNVAAHTPHVGRREIGSIFGRQHCKTTSAGNRNSAQENIWKNGSRNKTSITRDFALKTIIENLWVMWMLLLYTSRPLYRGLLYCNVYMHSRAYTFLWIKKNALYCKKKKLTRKRAPHDCIESAHIEESDNHICFAVVTFAKSQYLNLSRIFGKQKLVWISITNAN